MFFPRYQVVYLLPKSPNTVGADSLVKLTISSILFLIFVTIIRFNFAPQFALADGIDGQLQEKTQNPQNAVKGNPTTTMALWTEEASDKLIPSLPSDRDLVVDRDQLKLSIANSIQYLNSERAVADYKKLNLAGVSRERVLNSLLKFSELLDYSSDYNQLTAAIAEHFVLMKPQANSVRQSVQFTGYFQPTYFASRYRSAIYKYPIYRLPEDFASWPKPHPKRVFLEGYEGWGNKASPLSGNELAFFASRWEAFMVHVQGSAILTLPDNSKMAVGFAGATDYPFRGVSKSFLQKHKVAWSNLGDFFQTSPQLLNQLLVNNNRFIFFNENPHALPVGSLGVPVIPERSIATDKSLMPPGALSVVSAKLPMLGQSGEMQPKPELRFVLDQDTGSAIRGSARVDIFMGTGPIAQKKANAVFTKGDLYYLILK
jgi:membrane-bound lytic murein transglycosylase A